MTVSFRGMFMANLRCQLLHEGLHSGDSALVGFVSCFATNLGSYWRSHWTNDEGFVCHIPETHRKYTAIVHRKSAVAIGRIDIESHVETAALETRDAMECR
eukprot:768480_1